MKTKLSTELVKQARKMNWKMIQAKKEGNKFTEELCRDFVKINMQYAGQAWIVGN